MALFKSLRRLFGGTDAPKPRANPVEDVPAPRVRVSSAQTRPDSRAPGVLGDSDPSDDDVEKRFTCLLLGVDRMRQVEVEPPERLVIEQIRELARRGGDPDLIPRLPVALPRVINMVRRDDVSPREMAERLSHDPALVGEVVRIANSPRYRTGRDIANLQEAVLVLGQRGLMQLVTNVTMRPIFNAQQGRFSRIAGTRLWDLSERSACACAHMCGGGSDTFQAYLAGMASNVGLIAVLRILDLGYKEPQPPDTEGFHHALLQETATLSGQIARHWEFPPNVCHAVAHSADPQERSQDDELVALLRSAVHISKWHVLMPGLSGAALATLPEPARRGYLELERVFGH